MKQIILGVLSVFSSLTFAAETEPLDPKTAIVLLVKFGPQEHQKVMAFQEAIKDFGPNDLIEFQYGELFSDVVEMIVAPSLVSRIEELARENDSIQIEALSKIGAADEQQDFDWHQLNSRDLGVNEKMGIVNHLVQGDAKEVASDAEFLPAALTFLKELDQVMRPVVRFAQFDLARGQKETPRTFDLQTHPFFKRFIEPAKVTAQNLFYLIHEMGTDEGARFLLRYGHGVLGAGWFIIEKNDSYLGLQLDWLRELMRWPQDRLGLSQQEQREAGFKRETNRGTVYPYINIEGRTIQHIDIRKDSPNYGINFERIPYSAFYSLGLKAPARTEQESIVDFIFAADEEFAPFAELQSQVDAQRNFLKEFPEESKGAAFKFWHRTADISPGSLQTLKDSLHQTMAMDWSNEQVINYLVDLRERRQDRRPFSHQFMNATLWHLHSPRSFRYDEKFSARNYFLNTLDIFIKLYTHETKKFKSRGYYASLLNATQGMFTDVESEFGPNGEKDEAIAKKVLALHLALEAKLLAAVSNDKIDICEWMLKAI
jgi:hypothetical protein